MEKVIKRGYVKWTDDDGEFHKELLSEHPELLTKATPKEQLAAEEARRLSVAGEKEEARDTEVADEEVLKTLEALKKAPENVLTAASLTEEVPTSAVEEDHDKVLAELRESTLTE